MSRRKGTGRPETSARENARGDRLALAAVLLGTFVALSPTLGNGFTNWDDPQYVTQNPLLRDLSPAGLAKILVTPVVSNYHPVTILSLALDRALFGEGPWGFHATNLLFHLLNTALVFLLARRLFRTSRGVAAFVALLFGIHPLHVEPVAWISSRKDVLYAFFFFAALLQWEVFLRTRRRSRYAIAFALFVLAAFSKPAAVVFPVVLLLVDFLLDRRDLGRCLLETVPFFAVSIAAGLLTVAAQSDLAIRQDYSFAQRVAFGSWAYLAYIVRVFVPIRLSALHPYPQLGADGALPLPVRLAPWVAIAATAAYVAITRKRRIAIFGLLFFLVTIALVLQFVTVGKAILAERYTYVPYFGLFLPLALALGALAGEAPLRTRRGRVVLALSILWIAGLGGLAFRRTFVWRDGETMWSDVIAKYPGRALEAYSGRGNERLRSGRIEAAIGDYDEAIRIAPDDPRGYFNRAQAYARAGKPDRAEADLSRAIELLPDEAEFRYQRALVRLERGESALALADLDACLARHPDQVRARMRRANLHARARRFEAALTDYDAVLARNPRDAEAYFARGSVHAECGDYDAALADLTRGLELRPSGEGYWNRSLVHARLGRRDDAVRDAVRAKEMGFAVDPAYLRSLGVPDPGRGGRR